MTVEYIYIARHGYRMNWVTDDWKSATGLPRDPALSPTGVTQAEEVAEFFKSLAPEERPTAIFSSPYYRCLQTAKPTAEALQVPLFVEHGLSEWYSQVEPNTGLHPRPGPASELRAHFPQVDAERWPSLYYPSRKGESVPAVHDRSGALIRALVPAVEARFDGAHRRILLVSHAATVAALARELVGDREAPLSVATCSITGVRRKDLGAEEVLGGFTLERNAEVGHLSEGAQRPWGFHDAEYIVDSRCKGKGGGDWNVVAHRGEPGTENELDHPVGLQVHLLPVEVRERLKL
ncbi:phosphoglycerate mutase-like protein [Epithele typhae]|uniref:phosphoglycerate mutase-like protein n=1 Tax=Epithele typhae TaxID=378194 RepID=UPI002007CEAE|nr:phosphoglycerate mutase-like protein [Epithele typhae]KAH9944422.1 phosphoglycerate mutase-like protein [Epithele typhae]